MKRLICGCSMIHSMHVWCGMDLRLRSPLRACPMDWSFEISDGCVCVDLYIIKAFCQNCHGFNSDSMVAVCQNCHVCVCLLIKKNPFNDGDHKGKLPSRKWWLKILLGLLSKLGDFGWLFVFHGKNVGIGIVTHNKREDAEAKLSQLFSAGHAQWFSQYLEPYAVYHEMGGSRCLNIV